jgi:hypothetical protein
MKKAQEMQKDGFQFREDKALHMCNCLHKSKSFWFKTFKTEDAVRVRSRILCSDCFEKGKR